MPYWSTYPHLAHIYVVVQFYPWFNFDFPLFLGCMLMYAIMNLEQRKIKIKPRTKLNHNIYKYPPSPGIIIKIYYIDTKCSDDPVIWCMLWFQEEIRFCINPELLVAQMFMEAMQDNECIVIRVSFNQLTFNQRSI